MYIPAMSTDIHGWQITRYKIIDTLVKGYTSWLLNQGLQRMFQAQPAFSNIPSTMGTRTGSVHTLNSSSKPWSFYVENPCDRVGKIGNDQSVKMFLLVHLFILYPMICLFHLLLSRVLLGIFSKFIPLLVRFCCMVGSIWPNLILILPNHFTVTEPFNWSTCSPSPKKKGHKELRSWVLSKCLWSYFRRTVIQLD